MAAINSTPSVSASVQPPSKAKTDENMTKKAGPKASKISSSLLADIVFEHRNKPQPRLPPNHTIHKRPITHPPIAAPYAGPDVQKVVYVSRNTPIMAAVKRVKKLLEQAEKRNLQREGVLGNSKRAANMAAAAQNKERTKQEVVLVKGSGRAIEQAAKVGEWFKRHAEDGDGGWVLDVRPTSVKVIDDIAADSSAEVDGMQAGCDSNDDGARADGLPPDNAQGDNIDRHDKTEGNPPEIRHDSLQDDNDALEAEETASKQKTLQPKKRKRPTYDEDDVPEARTRFINAIEIAVSFKR